MTAADWSALAEWVVAASILGGVVSWSWRERKAVSGWFTRGWRRSVVSVLRSEVTAGAAWQDVKQVPEASMEAGIAYARTTTRSGRAP